MEHLQNNSTKSRVRVFAKVYGGTGSSLSDMPEIETVRNVSHESNRKVLNTFNGWLLGNTGMLENGALIFTGL